MKKIFCGLWKDEQGQGLSESALLLVLVCLVAVVAMKALGSETSNASSNTAANLMEAAR